ncbi:YbaB/EbfC family nucleoid-associated protein [Nocardia vinacea]|uniref:YbaB/EbfC family nucleoid-associated protein n=1 Tax=Nocardia vinacea TaxID=96468 RepID=UPI0002FE36D8|nr:YbaB/EbfC family nucleoid-associated protein [Nocardia vinacea]
MKLLSGDPGQAADELAKWAENLERKAQQYQSLHGRMATVTVTETSSDNRISVTVDANGVPTDIRLSAAARGMDPAVISGEIMSCMRRAQAKLRNQVTDMVHDAVGDDAAGAAIIGQYIDRFPDVDPVDPVPTRVPEPPMYSPPPTSFRPEPPPSGTRKPNRDDIVVPDEPSEEDLYYQRKSWLE